MVQHQLFTNLYSGLSGLNLPIPKFQFPPPFQDASRLTYYATFFNSIEINSSFYKIPQAATIRKWKNSVPDHFRFTFKLWKQITHCKGLHFEKSDVERYMQAIAATDEKRGCLLIQFPPSAGIEHESQLSNLLSTLKDIHPDLHWPLAVEFRNKSWYEDRIYTLVDSFNATVVIHDIPKSATPMIDLESDIIYVRFHGPTGNYRDSYTEEILEEHASYVKDWIVEGKRVYVYFNNTAGDAFENCRTLKNFVEDQ